MARSIKFSEVASNQKFTKDGYSFQKNNEYYNALSLAGGHQTAIHFDPDTTVEVEDAPVAPKYKKVRLGTLKPGQVFKEDRKTHVVREQLTGILWQNGPTTVTIFTTEDHQRMAFASDTMVDIIDDGMCRLCELKRGERFIDEKDNPGKTLRKICIGLQEVAFLVEGDDIAYTTNSEKLVKRIS